MLLSMTVVAELKDLQASAQICLNILLFSQDSNTQTISLSFELFLGRHINIYNINVLHLSLSLYPFFMFLFFKKIFMHLCYIYIYTNNR